MPADLGIGPGRVAQMVAERLGRRRPGRPARRLRRPGRLLARRRPRPARPAASASTRAAAIPATTAQGRWRGRPPRGAALLAAQRRRHRRPPIRGPGRRSSGRGRPLELGLHPAPLVRLLGRRPRPGNSCSPTTGRGPRSIGNFGGQRPPVLMEPRPLPVGGAAAAPARRPHDRRRPPTSTATAARARSSARADGRVFAVHAGPAATRRRPPEPLLPGAATLRLGGHAVVAAADLDGDGDLDLIAGDGAGRLLLVEDLGGPGDHRYAAPSSWRPLGLPVPARSRPRRHARRPGRPPARLRLPGASSTGTANGRPDLIVGGAGGEVLFFRNNGGATQPRFDRPEPLRCEGAPLITPPRVRPAAADWEGQRPARPDRARPPGLPLRLPAHRRRPKSAARSRWSIASAGCSASTAASARPAAARSGPAPGPARTVSTCSSACPAAPGTSSPR